MKRKRGGIALAGKFVSRTELMQRVIDELSADITTDQMLEIVNTFFSAQVVSEALKRNPSIPIPGAFTIRLNPKIIAASKRRRKNYLKKRKKEYMKKHPEVRRRMNPYMKKYMSVYQHNKWREINGLPKKNRKIRKNTLLFRTMPSLKVMRKRYPEYFKTHAYQKRKKTWQRKKEEGLNMFKLSEEKNN